MKLVKSKAAMCGNWSTDAVQEGYANALQYWYTYDFNQPFEHWIARILSNSVRKMSNWIRGYQHEEAVHILPDWIAAPDNPFNQQKASLAYNLIQDLPDPSRTCLQYALVDQCKYEEVALLTGEKMGTIKTWVKRFRDEHKELYR